MFLLWTYDRLDTALNSFTNLALRAKIRNDDGIDQLHHFVTVTILAFFGAITGFVEYAGEPINCWNYGDYLWKHFQVSLYESDVNENLTVFYFHLKWTDEISYTLEKKKLTVHND